MDEIVESDVELDDLKVVDYDYVNDPQEIGKPSGEDPKNSQALKLAMGALLKGNLEDAKNFLTRAIIKNPKSPMLFASRASVFVKLKKANYAIADANAALKMNADSAKAYKARGMAWAQLRNWKRAAKDLRLAFELDFDEEAFVTLKKVESNIKKIEEHLLKLKRHKDVAAASVLRDGEEIEIHGYDDLSVKLGTASQLSRLAVIFFTKTGNDLCRVISPAFPILAQKHPKVVCLKVDIDEVENHLVPKDLYIVHGWHFIGFPTFLFLKKGREVDRLIETDEFKLDKWIAFHAVHDI